jgi:hypothetical protein
VKWLRRFWKPEQSFGYWMQSPAETYRDNPELGSETLSFHARLTRLKAEEAGYRVIGDPEAIAFWWFVYDIPTGRVNEEGQPLYDARHCEPEDADVVRVFMEVRVK